MMKMLLPVTMKMTKTKPAMVVMMQLVFAAKMQLANASIPSVVAYATETLS